MTGLEVYVGLQLLQMFATTITQAKTRRMMADTQREIAGRQMEFQREQADRQMAFQREQYEQQRRNLLADAEQRRQESLRLAEEQHVLQNWPLRLFPSQLLGRSADAAKAKDRALTPLVILLAMPAPQTVEGQTLDIQNHVRNRLQQFLATHYNQNTSARPVELLDLAWKDPSHRGGSAIKALHGRLDCLSTVVLEADVVQNTLPFQFAWWGPLQEGYQYQHLGEIDWRELLKESVRERARQWRQTRSELVRQGLAANEAEADQQFGGENAENLKILEQEERLKAMPGVRLRPYTIAQEDFDYLYRHLTAWYCLATALVADLHHFRYNDTLPLLPELLPELLKDTTFPQQVVVELLLRSYETFAVERPDLAAPLARALGKLPRLPAVETQLKQLESIAQAQRRAEILIVQDMHGRPAAFVQQRQRDVAEVLGLPVAFHDPLKSGGKGPEMVVIPPGRFLMGSPASEEGRSSDEEQHRVEIKKLFAIGRYAVTFAEYDTFCAETGCEQPDDQGWGRGNRPVINITWFDAWAYADWLTQQTGQPYRLPTEAEWEYAARAGTATAFWWGNSITTEQANYDGNYTYSNGRKGVYRQKTVPVGEFQPNPWGLYQVHGNVWEWTGSAYQTDYGGSEISNNNANISAGAIRGGSWLNLPAGLRSASRPRWFAPADRSSLCGVRLARVL